jgi:hypothetical protein
VEASRRFFEQSAFSYIMWRINFGAWMRKARNLM